MKREIHLSPEYIFGDDNYTDTTQAAVSELKRLVTESAWAIPGESGEGDAQLGLSDTAVAVPLPLLQWVIKVLETPVVRPPARERRSDRRRRERSGEIRDR